ncbi:DnaJ-domain-containing protein [Leucosporidium creatinivorum]|uniref:DnaJ-domain-containing protein n=1 Tax=Leucosporidium creatinivorum TaxID=106004 RepID=A0A1Y2EPE8_9BASI|nr:DnaJ-domain-containing protein [Leucosporidium creatinivorum]
MASFPDYYSVLGVAPTATPDQIKTAYKRKSLLCHPDRVPAGPGSDIKRKAATTEFQAVADAYYTLSDTGRRASYDRLRTSQPSSSRTSNPTADASSFFNFFSSRAGAPDDFAEDDEAESEYGQPDAEYVFGNVFEDMLRPEVNRHLPFWTWTGAAAGAALGFIAGNLPGAAIGGFAGSKLGAVRDAKGKAVYEVFKDLGADQKAEVLKGLAAKVFGMSGIGGASR